MSRRRIGLLSLVAMVFASGHSAAEEPENLRRAAAGVWVGGAPSDDDWSTLTRLGIRTVVAVDGAPPDAPRAASAGIRVVHVPLGYAGVEERQALALTRVARDAERPIYVYCHHGRHRGPAAAAIVCRAAGLLDARGARQLLVSAGTDPRYEGLWRDVAAYTAPRESMALPPLVESAPISPLRLAMSELDTAWDAWLDAREADRERWRLAIAEALRESKRFAPGEMHHQFDRAMRLVEPTMAERASVEAACVSCHTRFRDRPIESVPTAP